MMNTQAIFGSAVLALVVGSGLNGVGSIVADNPNIEVHSLTYIKDQGLPYVVQDRTVGGPGAVLVGFWDAEVFKIEGPRLTLVCEGSGGWPYQTGRKAAKIAFDEWVGEVGCYEKLGDGDKIILSATYTWGAGESKTKRSEQAIVDKSVSP